MAGRSGGTHLLGAVFSQVLLLTTIFATAQIVVTQEDALSDREWGYYPAFSNVPEKYILFNETTLDVLDRIATPARRRSQRAVIFTTLRFGDAPTESVMGMISTFCYHLDRQGMLQHTMLITTDEATWQHLHDRGFPAFLDRSFPRRPEYVDAVEIRPETDNRVSIIWHGCRLSARAELPGGLHLPINS